MKIHSSVAYRRRKKRRKLLFILMLLTLVGAACFLFFFPLHRVGEKLPPESGGNSNVSLPVSSEPEESSEAVSEAVSELPPDGKSLSPADPSSELAGDGEDGSSSVDALAAPVYDYSQPVPESEPVDNSYFDNVVFVGNSRTQGFVLYAGLPNITAYTDKGLTVDTAATKEIVPSGDGEKISVLEALRKNSDCKAVYMMFGINELGWTYSNVFIDKYADLVDTIKDNHPGVEIYLQSILPVGKQRADGDKYVNNDRIHQFNELILKLAEEKQVYYVDVYEAVADENGALPDDAAADGVHLRKPYCEKWREYLKSHVAPDLEPEDGQANNIAASSAEQPAAEE